MAKISAKSASKTEHGLTMLQELFCQYYVNADRELFGNGVKCYLETFGEQYELENNKAMKYEVACVLASRELSKVNIIKRINDLLQEGGFNDANVDRQHLFLINQHADLKTKMAAIKEYNAVKKRVEQKMTLEVSGVEISVRKSGEKSD